MTKDEDKDDFDIGAIIAPMKATHNSGMNQSIEWRRQNLTKLLTMMTKHEKDFQDALYADLHKDPTESTIMELAYVQREIKLFLSNLSTWMKPKRVSSIGAFFASSCEVVQSMPLSSPGCLVIAPFNYPVSLSILPVIGAIGGGNPVILKPSELCPNVSSLFARLVPTYFDKGVFQVVEGGVKVTTELMKQHWGLCLFTGSERVGRIIQEAAAKTLTPTILELGGKSPCYIAENCPNDMRVICNRIAFGKLMNAGQTCVAPDFILCHESKVEHFCDEFEKTVQRFGFSSSSKPTDQGMCGSMARMATPMHAKRLIELIKEVEEKTEEDGSRNKIVFGGSSDCDLEKKIIVPTLILNPSMDTRVMTEEIFGPILPVITVKSDNEAIEIINDLKGLPLALYVFTKDKKTFKTIISKCRAGAALQNDAVVHFAVPDLPFGGIGTSGIGRYTGKASFDAFTHKLSTLSHPCHAAFETFDIRYPPFGNGTKSKLLIFAAKYLPELPPIPRLHDSIFLLGVFLVVVSTFFLSNVDQLRMVS